MKASDLFVRALENEGVEFVFGIHLVTGLIVIGASRFGLPVSTTHVSCGSLFGIGAVTGQAHKKTIATILLAWFVTRQSPQDWRGLASGF